MFILCEYAACLVAALVTGTLLFTACAMCVMLWTAGGITWRWWRELAPIPNGQMGRWRSEPRVPKAPWRSL